MPLHQRGTGDQATFTWTDPEPFDVDSLRPDAEPSLTRVREILIVLAEVGDYQGREHALRLSRDWVRGLAEDALRALPVFEPVPSEAAAVRSWFIDIPPVDDAAAQREP